MYLSSKNKSKLAVLVIVCFLLSFTGLPAFAGLSEVAANNPVLEYALTLNALADYDAIKASDFVPAFHYAIAKEREVINQIITNPDQPTFANTIEPLDYSLVWKIQGILYNLYYADYNDLLGQAYSDSMPLIQNHSTYFNFNQDLFEKVEFVYQNADRSQLNQEQNVLLDQIYNGFVDNGIAFSETKQEQITEIRQQISKLTDTFFSNLLSSSSHAEMHITDAARLTGLSESFVERAYQAAQEEEMDGWLIPYNISNYLSIMSSAEDREIRRDFYNMRVSLAGPFTEFDNTEIIRDIINLRIALANIYGYDTFADWILEDRMMGSTDNLITFQDQLLEAMYPAGLIELEKLESIANAEGIEDIQIYDKTYLTNRYLRENIGFDDQIISQYFELQNVKEGVFHLYETLYQVRFKERNDISVYHPDVLVYELQEPSGEKIGIIYVDFFNRDSKSSGAWCILINEPRITPEGRDYPVAGVVFNYSSPDSQGHSLLNHYDVVILLHEMGHLFHAMLSEGVYSSSNSFAVPWDFVEFPSTIMENWAYEPEFLETFARHYLTDEPIPLELMEKIKENRNMFNAISYLANLRMTMLDTGWHTLMEPFTGDVLDYERSLMSPGELTAREVDSPVSNVFSHIFDGGYAAGYYSYLYAEVMAADAYQLFVDKGIMNPEAGRLFREAVLSKGSMEDAMDIYMAFAGQEPDVQSFIEQQGWAGN